GFPFEELRMSLLYISRSNVISNGISKYMIHSILYRYISAFLSYDYSKLRFVIQPLCDLCMALNTFPDANHTLRCFRKNCAYFGTSGVDETLLSPELP